MNPPVARVPEWPGSDSESSVVGTPGGSRGFWIGFAAAWFGYLGLMSAASYVSSEPLYPTVLVLPFPAILSVIVAWYRRSLVNPGHSVVRTVGTLLLTGVLYVGLSALFTALMLSALDVEAAVMGDMDSSPLYAKLVMFSIVLYALLIGYLMWAVLVERVRESRALAAREAVLRAQAESKALRAQFNPHFVFNTLHSLMLLVREDPGTAERAIEDVASLIRYASNLDRRGQDVVPLSQEVEVAGRYLALERLRLEDRLEVVWEIADGLGEVAVPAFALQTLLENAIKHGLSPKPEGGTIAIRVRSDGNRMFMTVSDDGMGAAHHDIAASVGNGLTLLKQRMRSLYGDSAECSWHTEPGRGFKVRLEWPRTRVGETAANAR